MYKEAGDCQSFFTVLPESIDKFAAFGEIVRNCSVFDEIENRHAFLESVIRREKIQSTGIGHSVAIAHGKVSHLDRTRIALGISPDGIWFDDVFEESVHLVFLIASCPTKQAQYVKALANILGYAHNAEVRKALIDMNFDSPLLETFIKMMEDQDFSAGAGCPESC